MNPVMEIRDKVDQKLMSDPTLCGFFADYNRIACWGSGMAATTTLPLFILCLDWGLVVPDVSKVSRKDNPAGVSPTHIFPVIPNYPSALLYRIRQHIGKACAVHHPPS
jgi:hypothetical protein